MKYVIVAAFIVGGGAVAHAQYGGGAFFGSGPAAKISRPFEQDAVAL
jgi:hypothetical protein